MKAITLKEVKRVCRPETAFISISRAASGALMPMLALDESQLYILRHIVVAAMRGAVILEETVKIFDPPKPSNVFVGDILAEFQADAHIESAAWHGDVLFDCRLSTGSSQGDYEYTVALLAANVLESVS